MTYPNNNAHIDYRLARALETFNDAELLISNKRFNSGVNRLYYAYFYSVLAYLLKIGIEAKTHSGVKQMFGKHIVLKGLIDAESAAFFSDIQNLRITGDYDEFIDIAEDEAFDLLESGRTFINKMKAIINNY